MVAQADRKRHRLLPIALAIVLLVAIGSAAFTLLRSPASVPKAASTSAPSVDDGDEDDVSSAPLTTISTPTPAPISADKDAEVERAAAAVKSVIAALDEVGKRGDGSAVGAEEISTGWVLGELQSRAREQHDLGYRQTGEAVITELTTMSVDLSGDPATITFKACVDVSGIDVIDAAGKSLKDALYNPGRPVAHVYGAAFEDGTWKISTHEIPDVQDCPKP